MSLKKEQIGANFKRYMASADKYGFMTPELEELLGVDFIGAPASTALNLHNAFEGGLIAHILEVMVKAYKLNLCFSEKLRVDENSLMKVAALCQIGKTRLYVKNSEAWQVQKQGKVYTFNEEIDSMRVGERSLYYALTSGVELTEEEAQAILYHDVELETNNKYYQSTLARIVKDANLYAILEEKALDDV